MQKTTPPLLNSEVNWSGCLHSREKKVLLLETDNRNPDVWKARHEHESPALIRKPINLDAAEGWIEWT